MQKSANEISNSIDDFLVGQGYRQTARSGNSDIMVYLRQTSLGVDMITMVDMVHHPKVEGEYISKVVQGVGDRVRLVTHHEPRNLSLIIGERNEDGLELCRKNPDYWYLDAMDSRMYLYENQIQDFAGIRRPLEDWIIGKGIRIPKFENMESPAPKRSLPVWILASLNIMMYILTWQGIATKEVLALDASSLFEKGEVYRLFTYMFMHGNFLHIFYNLFVLFMVGGYVQRFYGSAKLTTGYLLSGIGGGIMSMLYSVRTGHAYISLGASGAIYGLFGMALFYMIGNKGKFRKDLFFRLGMALICMLLSSTESTNTDVMAHVGGFVTGFILSALMALFTYVFGGEKPSKEESGRDEN